MFEQERFIGRLQRHVMTEARILTCFLSGSFGRRADDAFSDVDIALVYGSAAERDAGEPQARNEPGELPRIAELLAQLRGVTPEALAEQTCRNAQAALPKLENLMKNGL